MPSIYNNAVYDLDLALTTAALLGAEIKNESFWFVVGGHSSYVSLGQAALYYIEKSHPEILPSLEIPHA